jgi:hypothetical protein
VVADVLTFAGILMLLGPLLLRVSKLFLASLIYFLSSCGVQVCNSDPAVTAVSVIAVVIPADPGVTPVAAGVPAVAFIPVVDRVPLLASLLILPSQLILWFLL